jgi:hypothetical protein
MTQECFSKSVVLTTKATTKCFDVLLKLDLNHFYALLCASIQNATQCGPLVPFRWKFWYLNSSSLTSPKCVFLLLSEFIS